MNEIKKGLHFILKSLVFLLEIAGHGLVGDALIPSGFVELGSIAELGLGGTANKFLEK